MASRIPIKRGSRISHGGVNSPEHLQNEMRCGHASTRITRLVGSSEDTMLYRILFVLVVERDELVVVSVSEAVS